MARTKYYKIAWYGGLPYKLVTTSAKTAEREGYMEDYIEMMQIALDVKREEKDTKPTKKVKEEWKELVNFCALWIGR